jgi:hypothetical protein
MRRGRGNEPEGPLRAARSAAIDHWVRTNVDSAPTLMLTAGGDNADWRLTTIEVGVTR